MKIARTLFLVLLATAALAQAPGEDRALGFIQAFNAGPDAVEAFAQANFLPAMLQRKTPAERQAMFDQIRNTHGKLTVGGVTAAENGRLRLDVKPERGEAMTVSFGVEPAPPHRLSGMSIDIGGGGRDRDAALPPLTLAKDFAAPLDAYVRQLPDFSGTVLVAKDGNVLFEKAYGLASRRYDVPNKTTTRFNIGSITKLFTKTAIAQLAQAGKLELDVPIVKYLPNYPNKEVAQKVTIQQLVDHTSGLGDVFTPRFRELNSSRFETPQQFVDFFASDPLKFEPGKGRAYSNYGYTVLGAIVEAVSGESYFDYIQKHVFDAARMTGSGFFDLRKPVPDLAIGHMKATGEWLENTFTRPSLRGIPAGGSHSTARDLLLFDRAVRDGKLLDDKWTRWWCNGSPDFTGTVAGGSPGVNAGMSGDGTWTVVVMTNTDPPTAEKLSEHVYRTLAR